MESTVRSWIGIAAAGAMMVSGCGDGARPQTDGPPTERELAVRWRGVEIGSREEVVSGGGADEARSILQYPVVTGAPTPEVRERLQAALSPDSAVDLGLERFRQEFRQGTAPRVDLSYRITYKRKHLLNVLYWMEVLGGGSAGRYGFRNRVVDLRTGLRVTADHAFHRSELSALARLVDARIQRDTSDSARRHATGNGTLKRFGAEDLDNFSIDDRGMTFELEYTFPDLFPFGSSSAAFTWAELRPYIRPDGPLAPFAGR
jgi:hypothetical protein